MTPEQVIAGLKVLSELIGAVIWPAVALFILVRFGPPLREFLSSISELTFKAAGVEATAKRRQVEAAAALGAALASKAEVSGESLDVIGATTRGAADLIADAVSPRLMRRLSAGGSILWVDDRPENNFYERQALEALGARVVLSTSTDDALNQTKHRRFDVIISDMGRPPDSQAGYTLLDELRKRRDPTPFIIYASSNAPEHRQHAISRGALGSTNQANELLLLVLEALVDRAGSR